jgi:NitT/TauT family transport system permease protein
MKAKIKYLLISIVSVIVVLAAWQLCSSTGVVDQHLVSSPWGVITSAKQLALSGQLGSSVAVSAELLFVGLAISIVVGTILGMLIGWIKVMAAVFEPFVIMIYAMPTIALLPVLLAWFGIGFRTQVVMVFVISVFPILVSVMTGTRNVDNSLIRLARSFRASEYKILRTIVLPSIVPYFVGGVRLGIGAGLIGVVVAEYFLGENGIGGLIVKEGALLQIGPVFVGLIVLALGSLALTSLLRSIEKRVRKWSK